MTYDNQGFKGAILYGIREVIDPSSGSHIITSQFIRFPVAVFKSEKAANDYVKAARLVSPQGGGTRPRVSFKKNSVLTGCFSATVGPRPHVDGLPVDPKPLTKETKTTESIAEPAKTTVIKPKRKRRTKAEMAAARAAETTTPKRRGRPPKKKAASKNT